MLSNLAYPLSTVGHDVQLAAPAPEYVQFAHAPQELVFPNATDVLALYVPAAQLSGTADKTIKSPTAVDVAEVATSTGPRTVVQFELSVDTETVTS